MAGDGSGARPAPGLPATVGRYRIIDRVGRGAMGVVYAAHDDEMDRPVAIKVLMGDLEHDQDARARFYREARAAAGLLHPNIITIYDAGEDQGRSYIAMQLLEGWPLPAYLKRSDAASLERKLDLMVQICEGLVAAHGRGIVHRDLKPGNLFVQPDGILKILDFGVARLADSNMTATGMMLGTPDYMSPEQARGTPVDARSDIFSAGAVFYFMLSGRKPFPGPDLPAILRQLQFDEPAPLSEGEIPAELARIIAKAMAKSPADRYPRVQDLMTALVRLRRAYVAETRRLMAELEARYQAAADAESEAARAAAALDLDDAHRAGDELPALRARMPSLGTRGGAHAAVPDRAEVQQALEAVEGIQHRLENLTRELHEGVRRLAEGERFGQQGDAGAAVRAFAEVSRAHPASRRARALAEEWAARAAEQEARDRRAGSLVDHARSAAAAGSWQAAIEACEEAIALRPGLHDARSLLERARDAIFREEQRRQEQVRQALDRAASLIAHEQFEAAAAALDEADELDPGGSATRPHRAQLAQAIAAAAERERLRQQTDEELRLARAEFARGRYAQALERLRGFVHAHPDVERVGPELRRFERIHRDMVEAEQARRQRSVELMKAAQALARDGEIDRALDTAHDAVQSDGTNADAAALLDELFNRDHAERVARETARVQQRRAAAAEPLLTIARAAASRGYAGAALEVALRAAQVAPDRADIQSLVRDLQDLVEGSDDLAPDLEDGPFPPPPEQKDRRSEEPAGGTRPRSGVLSHVNQWLSRRLPTR